MYLRGKGIFIWRGKPLLNGDAAAIANAAAEAGLTHVVVKAAGRYKYDVYNGQDPVPGMDPGERISRLDELAYAMRYYRNRRDALSGSARINELELLRAYIENRTAAVEKA